MNCWIVVLLFYCVICCELMCCDVSYSVISIFDSVVFVIYMLC